MKEGVKLYQRMMLPNKTYTFPIFEIKNTDTTILPVRGMGFGGPIWAIVSVDINTREIRRIEFEHKAESDGYGAAMTQSSFEDKFVGTVIDFEKSTFTLQRNIEKRVDAGTIIDGISGATMTSKAVVEMVNLGLNKYKVYFKSLKNEDKNTVVP
jgi:Na+-transporting NADH:ubiquinone oxidoreductase subunit C